MATSCCMAVAARRPWGGEDVYLASEVVSSPDERALPFDILCAMPMDIRRIVTGQTGRPSCSAVARILQ